MSDIPEVTILMPVFNREHVVGEAIQSVIEQDFADFEIVVVDDGSTDGTPEVLRAWAARDPRVRVVTSPVNLGIPAALNLGLRAARAPFIARFDSDDLMLPRRLAAQAAVLRSRADVVLVSCAFEITDLDGNLLDTWYAGEPHEAIVFLLNFFNVIGGHPQVMFRRDDVLADGGYSTQFPSSEDYELWIRLLRRGRIETLPLVGLRKRHHDRTSNIHYGAAVKRANWRGIMSPALTRYLGRGVGEAEVDALITVWRHDGAPGMSGRADRIMREAFVRFRREHRHRALRASVRRRIARQWLDGARRFAAAGKRAEAAKYVAHAAGWDPRMALVRCAGVMWRRLLAVARRSS